MFRDIDGLTVRFSGMYRNLNVVSVFEDLLQQDKFHGFGPLIFL